MSPRLITAVFAWLLPAVLWANPIVPPKSPPAPDLKRVHAGVTFQKDSQLAVNEFFAVIRIPRSKLQELLGEPKSTSAGTNLSFLMTIIAGVAVSSAAVATGLLVLSRRKTTAAVLLCAGVLGASGTAVASFAFQSAKPTEPLYSATDVVEVPCGEHVFSCMLETYSHEGPEWPRIQIRLAPNLIPAPPDPESVRSTPAN